MNYRPRWEARTGTMHRRVLAKCGFLLGESPPGVSNSRSLHRRQIAAPSSTNAPQTRGRTAMEGGDGRAGVKGIISSHFGSVTPPTLRASVVE